MQSTRVRDHEAGIFGPVVVLAENRLSIVLGEKRGARQSGGREQQCRGKGPRGENRA